MVHIVTYGVICAAKIENLLEHRDAKVVLFAHEVDCLGEKSVVRGPCIDGCFVRMILLVDSFTSLDAVVVRFLHVILLVDDLPDAEGPLNPMLFKRVVDKDEISQCCKASLQTFLSLLINGLDVDLGHLLRELQVVPAHGRDHALELSV